MRITPAFVDRAMGVLRDRGATPFEVNRFAHLSAARQVIALALLESDPGLPIGELLERVESLRGVEGSS